MNKKELLDFLFYHIGKQNEDFFISGMRKLENGEVVSTKWHKYSEICFPLNPWEDWAIKWVNQRQILSNEIVLDLEDKTKIQEVLDGLKKIGIKNYSVWETGSRGYHIHIFNKNKVSQEVKSFFCKKFEADVVKSGGKTMIALENTPHWKTGIKKEFIKGKKYEY